MKAAVLKAVNGRFEIEDIQIDKPKGREVLVEVKASGLCHTMKMVRKGGTVYLIGVPKPSSPSPSTPWSTSSGIR